MSLSETFGEIPVEDFFRKPNRDRFRLSPDGLSVSCLASFHGTLNLQEALGLVNALKMKGVPVRWLPFENEGHWISGEDNRMQLYRTLEEFLDTHLKIRPRVLKPGH